MVAYSFKARFADLVAAGAKRQTIRAPRKSRHARPGDPLTFYTGSRFKPQLIGRATCLDASAIELQLTRDRIDNFDTGTAHTTLDELHAFAKADGFDNWGDMRDWFTEVHCTDVFRGVLIRWAALDV